MESQAGPMVVIIFVLRNRFGFFKVRSEGYKRGVQL